MSQGYTPAVLELPGELPPGEHVLWQGAPDWRTLHRHAFHGRALVVYFAIMLGLRAIVVLGGGGSPADAAIAVAWLLPAVLFALGVIATVAWLTARATGYTVTNRRVVMRIGIVLEVVFNFPFAVVEGAGLHRFGNGCGDLALRLAAGQQIGYAHLWPHARPWHLRRPEPMLRCIPDADRVAELLARALAGETGGSALPIREVAQGTTPAAGSSKGQVAAGAAG